MTKRLVGIAAAMLTAAAVAGLGGCDVVQSTPTLPADSFVANRPAVGQEAGQGTDHSGALIYDAQHRPPREVSQDAAHISDTVRDSVKTPGQESLNDEQGSDFPAPASLRPPAPATQSARGISTGQYLEVGSVLAVVNEEPIFADKVLSTLDRPLKAEAMADSEQHFRSVAEDLISKQIHEFIDNDLEYAAAKKSLEKKDEQIANFVTGEWRKDQIRQAGGSEAQARQKAAEQGFDFDELVQQQKRLNMTRLYYQNKIIPLIQISAQDMRKYYQENLREFQKPAAAKFRVIFLASEKNGGRDAALEKARDLQKRAKSGEDFAALASKLNDDPALVRSHGAVGDEKGWMEKGAYASEQVETAVWHMKPGEVSDPIDAPDRAIDGFWIAKLEDIHPGISAPFESQKVQDAIREVLRREQFAKLREIHRRKLVEEAVIRENADVRQVTIDMVMQRYKVWTAGRGDVTQ